MFAENLRRLTKEKKLLPASWLLTSGYRQPMSVTCCIKKEPLPTNGLEALAKKYESLLLALESMEPERAAKLASQIIAAANLFPRKDEDFFLNKKPD